MKFSILMSIYIKEEASNFDMSMKSIWDNQILKPNDIVLVEDGPLTKELYHMINKWKLKLGDIFQVISLKKNLGLGDALNIGIKHCKFNVIARMDTDDISLPNRFKEQIEIMKNNDIDVCGSWVSEFSNNENEIISYRRVPKRHDEIVKFSKKRCPVNHPSIIYKKNIVEKSGGYIKMLWFEDYYLWARMIMHGAKFYNIQKPLVNMRAGYGQLQRRSGIKYAKSELVLLIEFKSIKFITTYQLLMNILIRFSIRIIPKFLIRYVYTLIRNF
ncbi:MAG: glycosyl transferase family 2 [Arcobacter sp.]|nr:MAG: glycosyl transferase family 2 [Arcobacter sp.]